MTHLDASHNKLTELIDFKPPKCMEFVNLSHNQITRMKDLRDIRFLK